MSYYDARIFHCRQFYAASLGREPAATGESGKEEALAAATSELERTFNKADFQKMKVHISLSMSML